MEEEECPQVVVSAEYRPLILLTCDAVEPFRAMQIKPKTELDYAGYPTPLTLPYTTLPYPPSTLLNLSIVVVVMVAAAGFNTGYHSLPY